MARAPIALIIATALSATTTTARAESALIAVATNFAQATAELSGSFAAQSPHAITITLGSTGKLYAQIRAGAPFDVFLAADQKRPGMLLDADLAVHGSRRTYAIGQLSLWSANRNFAAIGLRQALTSPAAVAIANPELAPYGAAARQALQRLKIWSSVKARIVMGENIGQTFALIATGNAPIGFVARAQLLSKAGRVLQGRRWDVPSHYHAPVRQDAVLLKRASTNNAAKAFLAFLQSTKARAIITRLGYKTATE